MPCHCVTGATNYNYLVTLLREEAADLERMDLEPSLLAEEPGLMGLVSPARQSTANLKSAHISCRRDSWAIFFYNKYFYKFTHILIDCQLPSLPGKLKDGDDDGDQHAAEEDDEDAAEVGEAELRAAARCSELAGAAAALLLPPLDLQLLQYAALLQRQHARRDGRRVRGV